MAPVIGYWDLRGLAEPIRYLLRHIGCEFEDKRYHLGPPPDFDREEWLNDKPNLGLDFPNLPYLIDGNVKISQSTAILRYIARKHDLAGSSEEERVRIDIAEQQLSDFRMNLIRVCYSPDYEKLKEDLVKNLPDHLKQFALFLGERKWFAGNEVTYVDFMAYDTFDMHRILVPGCLKEHINLKEYMERFEALPAIFQYRNSNEFKRWPIFGPMAKFGGGGKEPEYD